MARSVSFETPTDPTLFGPLQLRPRALLAFPITGMARWLDAYLVPYPDLVSQYRIAMVVGALRARYHTPHLQFTDAAWLAVRCSLAASDSGERLCVVTDISTGSRPVASVRVEPVAAHRWALGSRG